MAGDIMQRSEIELAMEEMLLEYGPNFFVELLEEGKKSNGGEKGWAVR